MTTLLLPLCFVLMAAAGPVGADPFDEAALAWQVWQRSPDVLATRQALVDVQAAAEHSHLLPNPSLTATWGSIPIGQRNTLNGVTSFGEVPNYSISVGQLFEIGKRQPRQAAAAAARDAASFVERDAYRLAFFALMEAISDQAAAVARIVVLQRLVAGSEESLKLQRARAERGDVAALEVDRLQVEHLRLTSSLHEAEGLRQTAAAACTRILARDCPQFEGEPQAQAFLQRLTIPAGAEDAGRVAERSDVKALRAQQLGLQAELTFAERLKIPDVFTTVGYSRDQFVKAGNQANSLNVSLGVPLPLFDRGQAEIKRVRSRLAINQTATESLSAAAVGTLAIGRQQLAVYQQRARILDEQAVPLARSVTEQMEAAARRGGVALPDVLLARRAFQELQLERVEVAAGAYRASLVLRRNAGALPAPRTEQ